MEGNDVLFVKRNNRAPMVVISWEVYANLLLAMKAREDVELVIGGEGNSREQLSYQSYSKLRAREAQASPDDRSEDEG
jgi:hypothetical protein